MTTRNCCRGGQLTIQPLGLGASTCNADRWNRCFMKSHPTLLIASLFVATVIASIPSANAANKFDGMWSAVFRTTSGPCQPAYRGAVQVVNGVVQIASTGGSLSGRVSANGAVSATGYMGANMGVASGRVSANSGNGTWRARMEGGNCAGVWTAQRR